MFPDPTPTTKHTLVLIVHNCLLISLNFIIYSLCLGFQWIIIVLDWKSVSVRLEIPIGSILLPELFSGYTSVHKHSITSQCLIFTYKWPIFLISIAMLYSTIKVHAYSCIKFNRLFHVRNRVLMFPPLIWSYKSHIGSQVVFVEGGIKDGWQLKSREEAIKQKSKQRTARKREGRTSSNRSSQEM